MLLNYAQRAPDHLAKAADNVGTFRAQPKHQDHKPLMLNGKGGTCFPCFPSPKPLIRPNPQRTENRKCQLLWHSCVPPKQARPSNCWDRLGARRPYAVQESRMPLKLASGTALPTKLSRHSPGYQATGEAAVLLRLRRIVSLRTRGRAQKQTLNMYPSVTNTHSSATRRPNRSPSNPTSSGTTAPPSMPVHRMPDMAP